MTARGGKAEAAPPRAAPAGSLEEREAAAAEDPPSPRPAMPSTYGIRRLDDALGDEPITEACVYCRTSPGRSRKENLSRQLQATCRRIEQAGVRVAGRFG